MAKKTMGIDAMTLIFVLAAFGSVVSGAALSRDSLFASSPTTSKSGMSLNEFNEYVKGNWPPEEKMPKDESLAKLFAESDTNKDGILSDEEFPGNEEEASSRWLTGGWGTSWLVRYLQGECAGECFEGCDRGCDAPMTIGQGDCDTDANCAEGLCGSKNCMRDFGHVGGEWDSTDDCCHEMCTSFDCGNGAIQREVNCAVTGCTSETCCTALTCSPSSDTYFSQGGYNGCPSGEMTTTADCPEEGCDAMTGPTTITCCEKKTCKATFRTQCDLEQLTLIDDAFCDESGTEDCSVDKCCVQGSELDGVRQFRESLLCVVNGKNSIESAAYADAMPFISVSTFVPQPTINTFCDGAMDEQDSQPIPEVDELIVARLGDLVMGKIYQALERTSRLEAYMPSSDSTQSIVNLQIKELSALAIPIIRESHGIMQSMIFENALDQHDATISFYTSPQEFFVQGRSNAGTYATSSANYEAAWNALTLATVELDKLVSIFATGSVRTPSDAVWVRAEIDERAEIEARNLLSRVVQPGEIKSA